MDASAERERMRRQIDGLLQIEIACRTPLPSHKTHARSCASFAAMNVGLPPLHETMALKTAIATGAMLGFLGPMR